jgi:predicted dehydrogenase
MANICWGIIGCGDVTEVKSGPAFNKIAGSRLYAVMRRNADKAKDYAKRHDVPVWYDDAMKLINDPQVTAIYVATPPSSHELYAIAAMEAGKPVYVEKPMTTDAVSAMRMADASKRLNGKLTIAHYRRQLPLFRKIKQLLDENYIGDIKIINLQLLQPDLSKLFQSARDNWRLDPSVSGGGFFHDLAPHQLDLLYYFFGKPVYMKGSSMNQGRYYEADDVVACNMVFEKNIMMNGLWCFTVPDNEAKDICEIIGSAGSMRFSIFTMQHLYLNRKGVEERLEFERVAHVQQPMIEKVVDYFSGKSQNPCTAEEGVTVMKMMDAFTQKH